MDFLIALIAAIETLSLVNVHVYVGQRVRDQIYYGSLFHIPSSAFETVYLHLK